MVKIGNLGHFFVNSVYASALTTSLNETDDEGRLRNLSVPNDLNLPYMVFRKQPFIVFKITEKTPVLKY